ncbi:electron transfer flavoprotein subunit beta/FixA family protein [Archaeoglobus profundus]|uniref:Electron transfer flavoprotein alpha/beta-subunit n=1 Tax=Archaeoglobus profundus (strain DSM 5631 / JCM 9629 / NBRC 100127 / Av18) TaxID=572546 RepID=D2RI56_ARCPA|nr:electron transfer flavoprotein subunit alpha [Archaeoglobus profundus]ADB57981.1 Electron transfer flavoprotein alpha/beta- subunit [Archaeoglobus profundus DSM 5631]
MNIGAIVRIVPDLVEGVEVTEEEVIPFRFVPNERDEHAVEEALIFKQKCNGTVEVIGLVDDELRDDEAIEEALAMAYAKGADKLRKIVLMRKTFNRLEVAKAIAEYLKGYDVIMIGIQSIDSFAGYLGGVLASMLGYTYIGGVVSVDLRGNDLVVQKEFGGVFGEYKVKVPAVLGIVSAEKPISFVPLTKLRQAMRSMEVEEIEVDVPEIGGIDVLRYYEPEKPEITIIEGDVEEVADKLVEMLKALSII